MDFNEFQLCMMPSHTTNGRNEAPRINTQEGAAAESVNTLLRKRPRLPYLLGTCLRTFEVFDRIKKNCNTLESMTFDKTPIEIHQPSVQVHQALLCFQNSGEPAVVTIIGFHGP